MRRSISLCGASLSQLRTREELLQHADDVIAGIRQGWLRLSVSHVLPLDDAAQAHRLIESRESQGKLLLSVAQLNRCFGQLHIPS
ncbi:MAG: zinc-binding dehydrogenase [Terriglobia bacterium]